MRIISIILDKMKLLKRSTKVFIDKISNNFLATQGKLNFKNMSRYIDIDEKTISRNYKKDNLFNISEMNKIGINEVYKKGNKNMFALDKCKNSKVKQGLEISLLSLMVTELRCTER